MRHFLGSAIGIAAAATISAAAWAGDHQAHWGYQGATGPEHWGELDPAAKTCAIGKHQSPIDITGEAKGKPLAITFHHHASAATVLNNGHTIQVNLADAGGITVAGKEYALKQFHFHTPSENKIAGKAYPMVAHLVHKADDGALAVVAVMFEPGAAGAIDTLPRPAEAGHETPIAAPFNAGEMLPASKARYTFTGSLTTPPCTEGVQWIVLKTPAHAAAGTIAGFHHVMGDNARPINPLNDRDIAFGE